MGLFGGGAKSEPKTFPISKTDEEWRRILTPDQ